MIILKYIRYIWWLDIFSNIILKCIKHIKFNLGDKGERGADGEKGDQGSKGIQL